MTLEYIFDPANVAKTLGLYPSLRQRLPDPADEGREAVNFKARKTGRQIYRILVNQHYSHLVQLLETLEYCLTNGYEQPKLLRTSVRQDYGSALAELFVADFFIRRGFKARSLEQGKGSMSVPDILVDLGSLSLSVEVYSPRDWGGMEDFVDELRLGILHLDVPWDFHFEITIQAMNKFNEEGRLLRFDPWQFSEATDTPEERLEKIVPLLSKIELSLTGASKSIAVTMPYESENVLVEVNLDQIQKSSHRLPARYGGGLDPTLTGYAPEAMFDQLVQRRVLKKIHKKQVQALANKGIGVLFVDLSRLGYSSEFEHSWYLNKFRESVEKHLDRDKVDVDWVVLSHRQ